MENEGLTRRWRIFAERLAEGVTAADAYINAGYKPATRHGAETSASRLRRNPQVRAYLAELRDTVNEEAREDTILSLKATLMFLTRIVKTSAATLAEGDELIQYSRLFKDGSQSIRMPDKLRALKMHADLCGYFDRPVRPAPKVENPLQKLVEDIRAGRSLPPPKRPRPTKSSPAADLPPSQSPAAQTPEQTHKPAHKTSPNPASDSSRLIISPPAPAAPLPNPTSAIRSPQSPPLSPAEARRLVQQQFRQTWTAYAQPPSDAPRTVTNLAPFASLSPSP